MNTTAEGRALQIEASGKITTLINVFSVRTDRQAALVSSLRSFTETHAWSFPGFIGAAIHSSTDGNQVINYAQWRSVEDLKSMLASVEAQEHLAEVSALADAINPRLHEVAYVSPRIGSIV